MTMFKHYETSNQGVTFKVAFTRTSKTNANPNVAWYGDRFGSSRSHTPQGPCESVCNKTYPLAGTTTRDSTVKMYG